uniref:RAB19, member RAS onco family n=1 Tax=Salvator merianae TaxID=96440 RepID=A0A8D0CD20_SALMN
HANGRFLLRDIIWNKAQCRTGLVLILLNRIKNCPIVEIKELYSIAISNLLYWFPACLCTETAPQPCKAVDESQGSLSRSTQSVQQVLEPQWPHTTAWLRLPVTKPILFPQIQVWDTAGQERFRTITQSYYRSAHGAILAYDMTRRSTFESIPLWIHEIEKYGAANLVLMLIGNKSDEAAHRQVLFEDACTLAEKHGLLAVLETSAKEAQNIDEVFILMAKELMARNALQIYGDNVISDHIHLDSRPVIAPQAEKSTCSC